MARVIIASKTGQLGNRILLFSHFIGASLESGFSVANPSLHEYANLFRGPAGDLFCRYPSGRLALGWLPLRGATYWAARWLAGLLLRLPVSPPGVAVVRLWGDDRCHLDGTYFKELVKQNKLILVQGWLFRSDESVQRHADDIRRFFQPVPTVQKRVDTFVKEARRGCDVLVGVHIRRGDYRQMHGGKHFFDWSVYRDLMEHVNGLFPQRRVRFLACSDECLPADAWAGLEVVGGPGTAIEDMYSLAGCDLIMGALSTFSMWASFYGSVPLYVVSAEASVVPKIEDFIVARVPEHP